MNRVQGKVTIVTGAARGQGESHSRLFAAEGAAVLMTDVLDEAGEAVAGELRAAGHDVRFVHMDVTSESDWRAVVAEAERRWGRVDILLNNAGIAGSMKAADEEDLQAWTKITAINQQGVYLGIKHVVPAMRRAGGGAIVNTCSINGSVGAAGSFSYQASKGAVLMMTRAAALEYVTDNIRVNAVSPGLVMTPMAEEEGEESNKAFAAATPMKRGARPEEVSYGVLFLASDEASYITGTDLFIDGGYTAQ
ncbi:glucose 1-dehydrogenase [Streptomyces sp. SID8361]|uniref:SDR family NAD(P)-dependent oxidoreductase n=1 Tax=Streptomyces sp. MnatMP-M27 TaxID=1839768 RepID=UPI00081D7A80|nr:glucose 1-dehydrogenase [Streptomyces sp. MnatMP-M27]MYU10218.1 glucose 1-dehydrogenase [Streptomyces sp. SID8361]SCF69566.1 cyclopentanol dehydrogenase [Streptomyces sp. MnatMP-M27]